MSTLDCLSRYDGLRWFRLAPLGEYCLGLTRSHSSDRSLRHVLQVRPDLEIIRLPPQQPSIEPAPEPSSRL